MKTFEFKSKICTTKEQSERLLALGLKKETADCRHWFYHLPTSTWRIEARPYGGIGTYYPAWSLGRLLEVMRMKASSQVVPLDDTFDRLIEGIETRIKEGYFNKDYLEERK